jgi:iron complex outermembrane receptor protein
MRPPVIPGLSLGATYYNIDFKGIITVGPINLSTFYATYGDKHVVFTKGDAAMAAFFDQITVDATPAAKAAALAQLGGNFANVYAVLDGRTNNQARVKTSGIDFYTRYINETSFGDVYADIAGTYILTLVSGGTTASADVNGFDPNNKLKVASTLGTHIGNLQAQGTWLHTSGTRVAPTAQNLQQSHVGGMDVFNLFFQYNVPGESALLKDLTFSVNVDNVFDTDPPLYRGGSASLFGAANGFTIGRVIKFGVSKRF